MREDMEGMGRTAISSIDLAMAMLPGAGAMEAGGSSVENPMSAALNLGSASYPLWQRTSRQYESSIQPSNLFVNLVMFLQPVSLP